MIEDAPTDDDIGQAEALRSLEESLRACSLCGLCGGRTQVVFGVGSPSAELMFVGEGPGFHEDRQGEPFVGQASA
jgi:uracil-DNA glycosylase